MGNVKQCYFDANNSPSYLPKSYKQRYANFLIKKDDILISMTGTVGKTDYGNVCMINIDNEYFLNQRVGKFEPNRTKLNNYYLLYISNSDSFKTQLFKNSSGGIRQANISVSGIESIEIFLPTVDEQLNLVEKIQEEEKAIEECKKLIEIHKQKINDKIQSIWENK